MKTFVITPTYNEAKNIGPLVQEIQRLAIGDLGIIVVDDNSPDLTGELADRLSKRYRNLFVIHRPKKLGLGSAYKAGFKLAIKNRADVVVTMDADFSHNPAVIPPMLAKINGFDMVIGSRYVKGGKIYGFNIWRHILSGGAQLIARILLGTGVHDSTTGFRAYKISSLAKIGFEDIKSEGYSYLLEAVFRANRKGLKIGEVPITYKLRKRGKSKLSNKEIFKAFETVGRLLIYKYR